MSEYYTEERCYITELVLPGVTTRWHRLRGTTERYLMLEGTGRVEIEEAAARMVGPGDVVRIAPMCRQRITNVGETDLIFLALCTPRFRQACYEDVEKP